MKNYERLLALLLAMVFITSLVACGGTPSSDSTNEAATSAQEKTTSTEEDEYPIEGNIVYFKDVLNWSDGGKKIYIDYWSDSDYNMVKWPGKEMTSLGNDVYSFELPNNVGYIIFSNDGDKDTQTRDIIYDGTIRKFMASEKQDDVNAHYATDWDGNDISSNAVDGGKGYDSDNTETQKIQMASDYVESVIGSTGIKKYTKSDRGYSWDTSKSERPAQDMKIDVTFDGYYVTNGYKVSELIADGFVLGSEDKEIDSGYEVTPFNCENKQTGRRLYLDLSNSSSSTKPAKDCEISGIDFLNNCEGVDYQGLTKGSSMDEAIDKLGIPTGGIFIGCVNNENPHIELSYGYTKEGTLKISFSYQPDNKKSSLYNMDFAN